MKHFWKALPIVAMLAACSGDGQPEDTASPTPAISPTPTAIDVGTIPIKISEGEDSVGTHHVVLEVQWTEAPGDVRCYPIHDPTDISLPGPGQKLEVGTRGQYTISFLLDGIDLDKKDSFYVCVATEGDDVGRLPGIMTLEGEPTLKNVKIAQKAETTSPLFYPYGHISNWGYDTYFNGCVMLDHHGRVRMEIPVQWGYHTCYITPGQYGPEVTFSVPVGTGGETPPYSYPEYDTAKAQPTYWYGGGDYGNVVITDITGKTIWTSGEAPPTMSNATFDEHESLRYGDKVYTLLREQIGVNSYSSWSSCGYAVYSRDTGRDKGVLEHSWSCYDNGVLAGDLPDPEEEYEYPTPGEYSEDTPTPSASQYSYYPYCSGSYCYYCSGSYCYYGPYGFDYDPFHANSISVTVEEGRTFVHMNLKHIHRVIRIDDETGEIVWVFGEDGDFTLLDAQGNPADASEWFKYSHDAQVRSLGDNRWYVTIHDNGESYNDYYSEPSNDDVCTSAPTFLLDGNTMTAQVIGRYIPKDDKHWCIWIYGGHDEWSDSDHRVGLATINGGFPFDNGYKTAWSAFDKNVSFQGELYRAWVFESDVQSFRVRAYSACNVPNLKFCPTYAQ